MAEKGLSLLCNEPLLTDCRCTDFGLAHSNVSHVSSNKQKEMIERKS